ncbi:MAG: type II toxin-antitoxin system VapB family antitoxin [Pseudomonadota bacterium]
MALSIKDPVTEELARELSRRTGENITTATRRALEERLQRVSSSPRQRLMLDGLAEIRRRWAAMPQIDHRGADEIIDYDENGLPR